MLKWLALVVSLAMAGDFTELIKLKKGANDGGVRTHDDGSPPPPPWQ